MTSFRFSNSESDRIRGELASVNTPFVFGNESASNSVVSSSSVAASRGNLLNESGPSRSCESTLRFRPDTNISPCGLIASFGAAHSAEPIPPNQQVALEILEIADGQNNNLFIKNTLITIGFTNFHQNTKTIHFFKHETSWSNKSITLDDTHLSKGDVLSYYYRSDGKVVFAVNGQYKGAFPRTMDLQTPVWATILMSIVGVTRVKSVTGALPLPQPPMESVQPSLPKESQWLGIHPLVDDVNTQNPHRQAVPSTLRRVPNTTASTSTFSSLLLATTLPSFTVATSLPSTVSTSLLSAALSSTLSTTLSSTVTTMLPSTVTTTLTSNVATALPSIITTSLSSSLTSTLPSTGATTLPFTMATTRPSTVAASLSSTAATKLPFTMAITLPSTVAATLPFTAATALPSTAATTLPYTVATALPFTMATTVTTTLLSKVAAPLSCTEAITLPLPMATTMPSTAATMLPFITATTVATMLPSTVATTLPSTVATTLPFTMATTMATTLPSTVAATLPFTATAALFSTTAITLPSTAATTLPSTVATTLDSMVAATLLPASTRISVPVHQPPSTRTAAGNLAQVLNLAAASCELTLRFRPDTNISPCGLIASFGAAYSAEPVLPNHQVAFEILEIADGQTNNIFIKNTLITIGFTNFNNNSKKINFFEQKPSWSNKSITPDDARLSKGDVLSYYYKSDGKVYYAVNGQYKGAFPQTIDTHTPVWATITQSIVGIRKIKLVKAALPLPLPPMESVQLSLPNLESQLLGIRSLVSDTETQNPQSRAVSSTLRCVPNTTVASSTVSASLLANKLPFSTAATSLPSTGPTMLPPTVATTLSFTVTTTQPTIVTTKQLSTLPSTVPTTLPFMVATTLPSTVAATLPSMVNVTQPPTVTTKQPSTEATTLPSSIPTTLPFMVATTLPFMVATMLPSTVAATLPFTVATTLASMEATTSLSTVTTMLSSTVATTLPSMVATTLSSTMANTLSSTVATTLPSTVATTSASMEDTTLPSTITTTLSSTVASTMPSTVATTLPSTVTTMMPSAVATTLASTVATTLPSAFTRITTIRRPPSSHTTADNSREVLTLGAVLRNNLEYKRELQKSQSAELATNQIKANKYVFEAGVMPSYRFSNFTSDQIGVFEFAQDGASNNSVSSTGAAVSRDSLSSGSGSSRPSDSTPRFYPRGNISPCCTIASCGKAYSAEPIPPDHQVALRIVDIADRHTNDVDKKVTLIDIGFVNDDPYKTNNMLFQGGSSWWSKNITKHETRLCKGDILSYYYRPDGKIHFAVNNQYKGTFSCTIDVRTPVWAAIMFFEEIKTIQLVEASSTLPLPQSVTQGISNLQTQFPSLAINEPSNFGCVPSTSVAPTVNCTTGIKSTQRLSVTSAAQSDSNLEVVPHSLSFINFLNEITATSAQLRPKPLPLHAKRGKLALTTNDGVVFRKGLSKGCAYVFTRDPVTPGQKISLKILGLDHNYTEPMHVGFTSCNPGILTDLPDRVHEFAYRPEYWIQSTISEDPPVSVNDELAIVLSKNGRVMVSRNESASSLLLAVDSSVPLWAYFDIYGRVKKVKLCTSQSALDNPSNTSKPLVETKASTSSQNTPTARKVLPIIRETCSTNRTFKHQNGPYQRLVEYFECDSNIVFSRQRVMPGRTVVIEVLSLESLSSVPLNVCFGFTEQDPAERTDISVFYESTVRKNCAGLTAVQAHDELALNLSPTGTVTWRRNDSPPMRLAAADVTSSLRVFIMYKTNSPLPDQLIKLWISEPPPSSSLSNSRREVEPDSDDSDDSISAMQRCLRRLVRPKPEVPKVVEEPKKAECMICLENPVNCALYSCGHTCMCFDCAKRCGKLCPVCRAEVKDILRIYT